MSTLVKQVVINYRRLIEEYLLTICGNLLKIGFVLGTDVICHQFRIMDIKYLGTYSEGRVSLTFKLKHIHAVIISCCEIV